MGPHSSKKCKVFEDALWPLWLESKNQNFFSHISYYVGWEIINCLKERVGEGETVGGSLENKDNINLFNLVLIQSTSTSDDAG